jgi:hypothetical protein
MFKENKELTRIKTEASLSGANQMENPYRSILAYQLNQRLNIAITSAEMWLCVPSSVVPSLKVKGNSLFGGGPWGLGVSESPLRLASVLTLCLLVN